MPHTSFPQSCCRTPKGKEDYNFAIMQVPQPDLFTKPPTQPLTVKHGQLSQEQVNKFFEEGFLVVPEFFHKKELEPVIEAIQDLVDILVEKLYKAGKIKDKHENATFYKRLTLIEDEFPGASVLLHKFGIMPKAFEELWSNERLLNVIEQFIGPEIAGHPVWNLRTKTRKNSQVNVPWHQDCAYLSPEAREVLQPTAWIPFLDATKENGCLEVARFGHKFGVLAKHTCCAGPTWYVDLDEKEMKESLGVDVEKDTIFCEVPFGGVLFLNNLIPHRSLDNLSDKIRWSLDLRWQVPDKPNGFYGLKENILLRTTKDPNYVIDWEKFASVDRSKLQDNYVSENTNVDKKNFVDDAEFDTTIGGPWMEQWEIVHHNKHTLAFENARRGHTSWHG